MVTMNPMTYTPCHVSPYIPAPWIRHGLYHIPRYGSHWILIENQHSAKSEGFIHIRNHFITLTQVNPSGWIPQPGALVTLLIDIADDGKIADTGYSFLPSIFANV